MYNEIVIICDDVRLFVKNGKLQTITVGNSKPFNYQLYCQRLIELDNEMLSATAYEDQKMAFCESNKLLDKFKALVTSLKRYNHNNSNPLLESLYKVLSEDEVRKVRMSFGKTFYNS